MLTIFTTCKPFLGENGIRQRNAIRSWTKLSPHCEIVILGDDEGSAEMAGEVGAIHVPDIERNEKGTPLVSGLFRAAAKAGHGDVLAYVNADIILFDDFLKSIKACQRKFFKFLMVGQRLDIELNYEVDFKDKNWKSELQDRAKREGKLFGSGGSDYFVYNRDLYKDIPPFAIGRLRWDNWLMFGARFYGGALVDSTHTVFAIHENHDYSHAGGFQAVFTGAEAKANDSLVPDTNHFFELGDATYRLEQNGSDVVAVRRPRNRRYFQMLPTVRPYLKPVAQLGWMGLKVVRSVARKVTKGKGVSKVSILSDNPVKAVSVIGLGKLGSPMAAYYAHRKYNVIGCDAIPEVVEKFAKHVAPVLEPGLQAMMTENNERLFATTSIQEAIERSDISFIIVPTPSEESGKFSNEYVLNACEDIGKGLQSKPGFHVVVITSTVMPGSTDGPIREAIEKASGKTAGKDFGICYSPEFIALGSVIHDLANPDFILLGHGDPRSGDILSGFYTSLFDTEKPQQRMSNINAEIAKISVNTYVTTKITFANMLANICEELPGADASVVTSALGLDKRIGPKYLRAAAPYGGPCFPRDNVALSYLADQLGVPALIAQATDALNEKQIERLATKAKAAIADGGMVGILGLSYKPDTDVITESPGVYLAKSLAESGTKVLVYDPLAMANTKKVLGDLVEYAESADHCVKQSDVIIVATAWPQFKDLSTELFRRTTGKSGIIDCWGLLKREGLSDVANYSQIGVGPSVGS